VSLVEIRHFVTFPVKLKKVAAGNVTQATQHGGVQNASYDFAIGIGNDSDCFLDYHTEKQLYN